MHGGIIHHCTRTPWHPQIWIGPKQEESSLGSQFTSTGSICSHSRLIQCVVEIIAQIRCFLLQTTAPDNYPVECTRVQYLCQVGRKQSVGQARMELAQHRQKVCPRQNKRQQIWLWHFVHVSAELVSRSHDLEHDAQR